MKSISWLKPKVRLNGLNILRQGIHSLAIIIAFAFVPNPITYLLPRLTK